MSKLSPSIKALIQAPFVRPLPCPAPSGIRDVYAAIARDAAQRNMGLRPWLAISAAATFTLNSPESLSVLYSVASPPSSHLQAQVHAAELMRQVGLKCISFNGIPKTINCLNALRASLPEHVSSHLATQPSRIPTRDTVDDFASRGRALWDSIYSPLEEKLYEKLGRAHPDLPGVIVHGHYGLLLADPPPVHGSQQQQQQRGGEAIRLGRALTSLVAISSLRAQPGVGPQVLSHVLGLRKVVENGMNNKQGEEEEEGQGDEDTMRWLAGDEGLEWILRTVDRIAEAFGGDCSALPGAKPMSN